MRSRSTAAPPDHSIANARQTRSTATSVNPVWIESSGLMPRKRVAYTAPNVPNMKTSECAKLMSRSTP